jgi:hypothetical protein
VSETNGDAERLQNPRKTPSASALSANSKKSIFEVEAAVLYWSAPEELAGAVTATGIVQEDHHAGVPEDFPATTGRVRRIRVESRDFREDRPRSREWVYAGPSASYRDVSRSPTRFDYLTGDAVRRRSETGVLVDLEVGD